VSVIADDLVLPFRTVRSGMMGRIVRLGGVVDEVLSHHADPEPVSRTLGEALALAALLGSGLSPESRLILQTKSDGPLGFLVVNYEQPGKLRGYASHDADKLAALSAAGQGRPHMGALIGSGHLAMTIDPGGRRDSHQGIVTLSGAPLVEVAHTYFRQSEQIPTFIRLAVAHHYRGAGEDHPAGWAWRAGGLMVQHLVSEEERARIAALSSPAVNPEDDDRLLGEDDDHWQRVSILAATVEDHELLDPTLSAERLLLRLFHEEGVRAGPARPLATYCRCSRKRIETLLAGFSAVDLQDMREADGAITVTCEFCRTPYRFELAAGSA
jgi:molecular chaperone Hsp33